MAYRRASGPARPKIAVSPELHARLVLASAELGQPLEDITEKVLAAWLPVARESVKVNRYNTALAEADRHNRAIRPIPAEFGLPPDYGIPRL